MSLKAGSLRHRVVLLDLFADKNETTGVVTESWIPFATVWAGKRPLSAVQLMRAGVEMSKSTVLFVIRYRDDIRQSMRLQHGANVYNIDGVIQDPDSGIEHLTLMVHEIVGG